MKENNYELKAIKILCELKTNLQKESWLAKDDRIANKIKLIDEAIDELKQLKEK